MKTEQTYLTEKGYKKLEEELNYLRTVRRKEIARRLELAIEEGPLLENAELEDARNEQSFVEGRILMLERMLGDAIIIEENEGPHEKVEVGSHVTITEGDGAPETYRIVGSAEADPTKGYISNASPLGRAMMGCKMGDSVTIDAPDGTLEFKIIGVK
ncbi:MAG: transcription elongation factor GreA [Anaerolineae bacterium]|jgi:transcription elongation factor GreA